MSFADAVTQLKCLWEGCFGDDTRGLSDRAMLEKSLEWQGQRAAHLPLTRDVVAGNPKSEQPRYGREEQSAGEPVLLLMAGLSEEQLALSVEAHWRAGCRRVVPFSDPRVWTATFVQHLVGILTNDLGVSDAHSLLAAPLVAVNPGDPADVFQKVSAWVRGTPSARPAVDCTGGQKPMDAGATYAASFWGLPAYYLDFEDYDPRLRRPLPWTCRYRRLSLPDAAFSLASRRAVYDAFRTRHFETAAEELGVVLEAAKNSGYLDDPDLTSLDQAAALVHCGLQWANLRYDDPIFAGSDLHCGFCEVATGRPQDVVERFLAPGSHGFLWQYLVDEYYRLQMLREKGEAREALVGCVGLVELVVDALFALPWFDETRTEAVRPLAWEYVDGNPPVPDAAGVGAPATALRRDRLPPASMNAKIKLLAKGRAEFSVWVPCGKDGADLRWEGPPVRGKAPHLATLVSVVTDSPPLQNWEKKLWKSAWGDFPHGRWVQDRHALVHLRAPLADPDVLAPTLDGVVPRFLELFRRMTDSEPCDLTGSGDKTWAVWEERPEWTPASRVPWHGRDQELASLLRLPP